MKKKNIITINIINKALTNFTMAKFCGAIITVVTLATIKYIISGNFHLEYCDFWNNVGIGLLGWTINTSIIGFLREYLEIKGINFNFKQILFGYETMKVGDTNISKPSSLEEKPKLYNAMENNGEGSNSGQRSGSNRGSIDRSQDIRFHPYPRNSRRAVRSWNFDDENENGSDTEMEGGPSNRRKIDKKLVSPTSFGENLDKSNTNMGLPLNTLDKGKGIETDVTMQGTLDKGKDIELPNTIQEPPFAFWRKLFPGLDPIKTFFPPKTNPGAGFAIPGGDLPISHEIRSHLHNGHVVSQFKKMDLETAIQQRNNYGLCAQTMYSQIAFAENAYNKVAIPTNEHEYRLRNKILEDLERLRKVKVRSEASIVLLNSRIEFIHNEINSQNNNN